MSYLTFAVLTATPSKLFLGIKAMFLLKEQVICTEGLVFLN